MTWKTITLLLLAMPAAAHDGDHGPPPWQGASAWPDRIVATFDGDPSQFLAVTWRTAANVAETRAEITLATVKRGIKMGHSPV